jgi:hypothetical protein
MLVTLIGAGVAYLAALQGGKMLFRRATGRSL